MEEVVMMMRGRERMWCTYIVVVAGVRDFCMITKPSGVAKGVWSM